MFSVSPVSHSGQSSNLKEGGRNPSNLQPSQRGTSILGSPLADWQLKSNLAEDLAL